MQLAGGLVAWLLFAGWLYACVTADPWAPNSGSDAGEACRDAELTDHTDYDC